jgi:dTMP kinase
VAKSFSSGLLIIFEGLDGVGKSTQLNLAKDELEKLGRSVLTKRNLGGTPIGEELRQVIIGSTPRPPLTDLYISAAIQAALLDQIADERLEKEFILMDRSPMSLAAYEIYGSGLDSREAWRLVDFGMKKLAPNLIIYYSTKIDTALGRVKLQSVKSDYFESKPYDYFKKVEDGYNQLIERYGKVVKIDANQSIETVHQSTMEAISQLVG